MNGFLNTEDQEQSDLQKRAIEFPDLLDVFLAERKKDEALAALDEGERVASEARETKLLSPNMLGSLQRALTQRRQRLADQLAEAACQPSTFGSELRAAISTLKKLGQSLRPSSTSYGGAYTAALSQIVFSAIARAATDSLSNFGEEPAYNSELVMWATKQTEAFAVLGKTRISIISSCWRFKSCSRVCSNSFRSFFFVGSSWLVTLSCAFETL